MCGIFGLFETRQGNDSAARQEAGRKMAAVLAHRGPDDEGLWQEDDLPLLLGHRRLSIIDLSAEGHQPKPSHSGRYIITYNGEIYNFPALQKELEALGVRFKGRSDTEIMLAAFDQWGINQSLQKLEGMFAFALWDRQERKLHVIRDRLGKKPLYIGWAEGALVFASELKVFHACPSFSGRISRAALGNYMRYGYITAPLTIYGNVWQLPAGCRMTLPLEGLKQGEDLAPRIEPYWHHPRIVEEARQNMLAASDAETIGSFEELLKQCIGERMVSDVPLGAFLSGGIDSSTVVALMQNMAAKPVKTFTIGFEEGGFDEAQKAKAVAAHLGTDHHELYLTGKDALDIIPALPDIYDEPFADESQIPACLISCFARQKVTVALSGDGGDEMLGGYNRHIVLPKLWARIGWMPGILKQGMGGLIRSLPPQRWDRLGHVPQLGDKMYKIAELLGEGSPEAIYRRVLSRWPEPEKLVPGSQEPEIYLFDKAWEPRGLSYAERLIYGDTLSYLPNDILVKVDRASMAYGLECRAPLLDRRICEYAWRLPLKMKIRDGKGKWLLRQVLSRYMPDSLFERPKQGFSVPIGPWLQGPLKSWAEDLLDERRMKQQGFLDAAIIRRAWDEHQRGTGNHAARLWTVLMFQSWLEKWQ